LTTQEKQEWKSQAVATHGVDNGDTTMVRVVHAQRRDGIKAGKCSPKETKTKVTLSLGSMPAVKI